MHVNVNISRVGVGTAILLGAMFVAGFAATYHLGESSADSNGPPVPPNLNVSGPVLTRTVPRLTSDQAERASALALADPTLRSLAPASAPGAATAIVWHESKSNDVIGAVVTVALAKSVTAEIPVRVMRYDQSEVADPPYESIDGRAKVTDMKSVDVFVDLRQGTIAALLPGNDTGSVDFLAMPSTQKPVGED